ncbi:MAG: RES domain-containing protein [Deltaproteobacteria bacterium]|nr:RES domain-containing protein [Deltaproteobacteria bacterium]
MTGKRVFLPDGRVWLRLASPAWADPLDPGYAQNHGGRWNPPGSFPALYLNSDIATARLQIERLLVGWPATIHDLDVEAYVLIAVTLPRGQTCADAVTASGLQAMRLPDTYPVDLAGKRIGHASCQPIGRRVHDAGLRGVWCRSACTDDGRGRELAWFPATPRSKARPAWRKPLPLGVWRHAADWAGIGLTHQDDPAV